MTSNFGAKPCFLSGLRISRSAARVSRQFGVGFALGAAFFNQGADLRCRRTRFPEKSGFARESVLRRWLLHPNISDEPHDCYSYTRVL